MHAAVHFQFVFDQTDYCHLVLDVLDHAFFDLGTHGLPVGLQEVLRLVDLAHTPQVVVIPLVEEALARDRQVRINAPKVLLLNVICIDVDTAAGGPSARQVEGDRWPALR